MEQSYDHNLLTYKLNKHQYVMEAMRKRAELTMRYCIFMVNGEPEKFIQGFETYDWCRYEIYKLLESSLTLDEANQFIKDYKNNQAVKKTWWKRLFNFQ